MARPVNHCKQESHGIRSIIIGTRIYIDFANLITWVRVPKSKMNLQNGNQLSQDVVALVLLWPKLS